MQMTKQGIARASVILIFGTLLSRLFGFLREVVIADRFGASATTDAFFIALTIPVLLTDFVRYSVRNSFVPVFSNYRLRYGDSVAWNFAGRMIKLSGFVFLTLSVVLLFASHHVIRWIAPGLSEQGYQLAVHLMKYLSFLVLLLGLAALLESIYNGFEHFIIPAFSPLALNITVILAVVIFSRSQGVFAITIGMLCGALLQLLFMSRIFQFQRPPAEDHIDTNQPPISKMLKLGLFIFLVQAIWGSYLLIDRYLASSLPNGSISALAFADRLIQLPIGVFVLGLSIAALPRMSTFAAQRNTEQVGKICSTGLRLLLFIIVPLTIFLCITRLPLVRIIYQRGLFNAQATNLTAGSVLAYALGLCAFAGQIFIMRVFFAFQDIFIPFLTGFVSLLLKIILSLILIRFMTTTGIALATSIAASGNTLLLAVLLKKKGYVRTVLGTWKGFDRLFLGWLLFGLTGYFAFLFLGRLSFSSQLANDITRVGGVALSAGGVYLGAMVLLRTEEIRRIIQALRPGILSRTISAEKP